MLAARSSQLVAPCLSLRVLRTAEAHVRIGIIRLPLAERRRHRPVALQLEGAGTLTPGAAADIALFRIDEGEYWFYDIGMDERCGRQMLVNTLTMVGGEELERMPEREPHFWAVIPEAQRAVKEPGVRVAKG